MEQRRGLGLPLATDAFTMDNILDVELQPLVEEVPTHGFSGQLAVGQVAGGALFQGSPGSSLLQPQGFRVDYILTGAGNAGLPDYPDRVTCTPSALVPGVQTNATFSAPWQCLCRRAGASACAVELFESRRCGSPAPPLGVSTPPARELVQLPLLLTSPSRPAVGGAFPRDVGSLDSVIFPMTSLGFLSPEKSHASQVTAEANERRASASPQTTRPPPSCEWSVSHAICRSQSEASLYQGRAETSPLKMSASFTVSTPSPHRHSSGQSDSSFITSEESESDDSGSAALNSSGLKPSAELLGRSDGPCSSSDLALSAMSLQKKDKLCLVCGDKALGYNFNAVSCESCKAFFRRNAHKNIRGRCEGKCDVTVESRSFCKRCRLAKCFAVGMRKDMILNDEQKKQRKQKIIINKLRRQGQLPPQDTYSASAKDLLPPVRTMASREAEKRTPHYPFGKQQLMQIKQEVMDSAGESPYAISGQDQIGHHPSQETPLPYSPEPMQGASPWEDSHEATKVAINGLEESDRFLIQELLKAMEASSFLAMSQTTMKLLPSNPEEFVNMAELFVRKVIKVAKNITFFRQLNKDDQMGLLKGSVVDIMMLRSAVNYDPFTESWSLNTKGCINAGSSQAQGERISAEILKMGTQETKQLFMTYSKFIKSLMSTIHGDLVVLKILILMSLFSADRIPMTDHKKVQEIQETYGRILEEYINHKFNNEATLFARIVMKLTDLRNINEVHSKMLLKMKVDEFEPLLLEIFDLPTNMDGGFLGDSKGGVTSDEVTSSSSIPTS